MVFIRGGEIMVYIDMFLMKFYFWVFIFFGFYSCVFVVFLKIKYIENLIY